MSQHYKKETERKFEVNGGLKHRFIIPQMTIITNQSSLSSFHILRFTRENFADPFVFQGIERREYRKH